MSMTVQDLIEALEQLDPTAMVIISRDPEGNSFAPVEDFGQGFFDTKFSEYFEDESSFTFEDAEGEEDDYDKPRGAAEAVVLWPSY